ncbi:uncharacterized protein LOC111709617, partial [Eurytemora carolleeae]|uniref:uncharacterized protein LOC111709617 n=1 Tax=Eurytemora carolleeae TaxID=1294199 RepID=UPI000C7850F6
MLIAWLKIASVLTILFIQFYDIEAITTTVYKKAEVVADSFVLFSPEITKELRTSKTQVQCAAACILTLPCNGLRFENGVCELGTVFCWGPPGELMSIYQTGPCLPKKAGAITNIGCPANEVDCYGNDLRLGNLTKTWEECAIQ